MNWIRYQFKNNQGYHLEHKYGHGDKNLSYNIYLVTLLAFYFHQIFELTDGVYQACRLALNPIYGKTLEQPLVGDWAQLMDLMLSPDDYEVMKPKKI